MQPLTDSPHAPSLLDRLLSLIDVDGRLDVRCELGASWALDEAAAAAHCMPFHALLAGQARVTADGMAGAVMQPGDVLMLPGGGPHQLHSLAPAAPQRSVFEQPEGILLCGSFLVPAASSRLIRAWLPPALLVRARSDDAPQPRMQQVLALMRAETEVAAEGAATVLRHLSGALFGVALRHTLGDATPPPGVLALSREPRLADLACAMLQSPATDWTLPLMASRAHMSRSSLLRAFQAAAALSPAQFLAQVRMAEAGRLLAQARQSVAAVGEAVGYASEAAFQRAFKRETGLTPAEWRMSRNAPPREDPPAYPARRRLA